MEVEYVLVGIFSEERGAVLGWAVSLVNKTWIVICDAFLVLNETESVSEILTLTWIGMETFDDSCPFLSLSPSLKLFLETFP